MSTIFSWFIFLPSSPCLTNNSMLLLETGGLRQIVIVEKSIEQIFNILLFWRKPSYHVFSRFWLSSVEGAELFRVLTRVVLKVNYRSQKLSAILFMNAEIYTSSVQCLQINFPFTNGLFNEMSESTTTAASHLHLVSCKIITFELW